MVLVFLYRCRMCGVEFKAMAGQESFVKDCLVELMRAERATTVPSAAFIVPGRYDLHHHEDGSVGFADVIGVKKYDAEDVE